MLFSELSLMSVTKDKYSGIKEEVIRELRKYSELNNSENQGLC